MNEQKKYLEELVDLGNKGYKRSMAKVVELKYFTKDGLLNQSLVFDYLYFNELPKQEVRPVYKEKERTNYVIFPFEKYFKNR